MSSVWRHVTFVTDRASSRRRARQNASGLGEIFALGQAVDRNPTANPGRHASIRREEACQARLGAFAMAIVKAISAKSPERPPTIASESPS